MGWNPGQRKIVMMANNFNRVVFCPHRRFPIVSEDMAWEKFMPLKKGDKVAFRNEHHGRCIRMKRRGVDAVENCRDWEQYKVKEIKKHRPRIVIGTPNEGSWVRIWSPRFRRYANIRDDGRAGVSGPRDISRPFPGRWYWETFQTVVCNGDEFEDSFALYNIWHNRFLAMKDGKQLTSVAPAEFNTMKIPKEHKDSVCFKAVTAWNGKQHLTAIHNKNQKSWVRMKGDRGLWGHEGDDRKDIGDLPSDWFSEVFYIVEARKGTGEYA